jgi:hypothetical protein
LPDPLDDDIKVHCDVIGELQILPTHSEHAGRDRSTRDAGYPLDLAQQRSLIETDQCANVEDHSAIPATRKRKADPVFRLSGSLVEEFVQ